MVEVPYLVLVEKNPEFKCPHCGSGISVEWENAQPDPWDGGIDPCPKCANIVKYGTTADGKGFLRK